MYACMYVCMHERMYVCMHVCMYERMYVCIGVCMHVCMYACTHVGKYAFMHLCMHVLRAAVALEHVSVQGEHVFTDIFWLFCGVRCLRKKAPSQNWFLSRPAPSPPKDVKVDE